MENIKKINIKDLTPTTINYSDYDDAEYFKEVAFTIYVDSGLNKWVSVNDVFTFLRLDTRTIPVQRNTLKTDALLVKYMIYMITDEETYLMFDIEHLNLLFQGIRLTDSFNKNAFAAKIVADCRYRQSISNLKSDVEKNNMPREILWIVNSINELEVELKNKINALSDKLSNNNSEDKNEHKNQENNEWSTWASGIWQKAQILGTTDKFEDGKKALQQLYFKLLTDYHIKVPELQRDYNKSHGSKTCYPLQAIEANETVKEIAESIIDAWIE